MKRNSLLFLLGIILVGCVPKPKQQSIFDNPICQPPCWQNITPGVSTKENALVILSKIKIVDQSSVDLNHPSMGFDDEIQFSLYKYHPIAGWIYTLEDHVAMISLEFNLGMNVQHAIDLFGAPENILVVHAGLFDQITLLNVKRGIKFDYKLSGTQSVYSSDINPNTEILGMTFFDPNEYERVLNSGILSAYTLSPEETTKNLRPWNGYGSIKDKYWPPATP